MKEHHRFTKLEGMLYLLFGSAEYLYCQLVEGVIITLAHLQRIPRITPFDLSLNTRLLRLFAERLLLRLILQLEQQPLLLEGLYGRVLLGH